MRSYTGNVDVKKSETDTPEQQAAVAAAWPAMLQNIAVISICPERLANCKTRLGPLWSYARVVDGVNGRHINVKELKRAGKYRDLNKWNSMRRGEIGCFMSHRQAWLTHMEGKAPEAPEAAPEDVASAAAAAAAAAAKRAMSDYMLILEDDADMTPSRNLLKYLQTCLDQLGSATAWDVLFIARNPRLCRIGGKFTENIVVARKTWGLFAYVVTREAAARLYDESRCMRQPVDVFLSTLPGIRKCALDPIPFTVVPVPSDTIGIK